MASPGPHDDALALALHRAACGLEKPPQEIREQMMALPDEVLDWYLQRGQEIDALGASTLRMNREQAAQIEEMAADLPAYLQRAAQRRLGSMTGREVEQTFGAPAPAPLPEAPTGGSRGLITGGSFLLDIPEGIPAVWGAGNHVLQAPASSATRRVEGNPTASTGSRRSVTLDAGRHPGAPDGSVRPSAECGMAADRKLTP